MMFDELALERSAQVERLLVQKRYGDAIPLLREEMMRRPDDARVMMQLADTYVHLGLTMQAVIVLRHVADVLASRGAIAKAITALKKLQKVDPSQSQVDEAIAALIAHERSGSGERPVLSLSLPPDENYDPGATSESRVPDYLMRDPAFVGYPLRTVEEKLVDEAVPSPLFDDFSHDELLALMRGLELQVFDPGDLIVAQGDRGASLFIITSGIAKAFVRGEDHRHRNVRTLHDGDFFGEFSILTGSDRTATITAATRCELLELDREALDAITVKHPRVREVLQRFYDERTAADKSFV